jgi:hypothetical protein
MSAYILLHPHHPFDCQAELPFDGLTDQRAEQFPISERYTGNHVVITLIEILRERYPGQGYVPKVADYDLERLVL